MHGEAEIFKAPFGLPDICSTGNFFEIRTQTEFFGATSIILIYIVLSRQFISGMTSGAIK